jgi:hypothetical protein
MASVAGSLRKALVVRARNQGEGEHAMTRTCSNRIDTLNEEPVSKVDLDIYPIDEEFDDVLDRELFAIRESLADFRSF